MSKRCGHGVDEPVRLRCGLPAGHEGPHVDGYAMWTTDEEAADLARKMESASWPEDEPLKAQIQAWLDEYRPGHHCTCARTSPDGKRYAFWVADGPDWLEQVLTPPWAR